MSWLRHRITILALVILIAHIIAIFALHTPRPMVNLPAGVRAPRLPIATPTTNDTIELDGLNDPLVFAGAHQHGFSALAWMMRPRQEYALTNTPAPPRFLAFSRTPTEFPPNDHRSTIATRTEPPVLNFNLPPQAPQSHLFVEGPLQQRPLLKPIEPPIQHATEVLTNTVIQLGVRADGFPISARIVTTSGSRGADLTALDLAQKSRFAPIPTIGARDPNELQWGELIFQWFTAEPTATNNPPKTAISAAR
jgi:hypothetical protein